MQRVSGIGGLFFKANEPKKLAKWYSDHLGVDLEETLFRGKIAPDMIPDLVLRCTKCTDPEACARLLASTERLEAAPSFCVNRETLEKLR